MESEVALLREEAHGHREEALRTVWSEMSRLSLQNQVERVKAALCYYAGLEVELMREKATSQT